MQLLDPARPDELRPYVDPFLERLDGVERAGEGNMNLVLRARGPGRSVILKQSRPWVEKYPDIAAPAGRIAVEAAFYRAVAERPELAARMPALLAFDAEHRVAVFEDLGEARDLTQVYAKGELARETLDELWGWLSALHALELDPGAWPLLRNREMRALNHAHIFEIPLDADNGLDLDGITPGLGELAAGLASDARYGAAVRAYGERYLADGPTLLHGDYYPGSWLAHPSGVKIIDPEFGFFGPAEFDAGVFLAHLHLAGLPAARVEETARAYAAPAGYRAEAARAFAGIEIMRRLIGVAQLPLAADLGRKAELLALSRALVLGRA